MRRLGVLATALALAGCATGAARQSPAADVSGVWTGAWRGYGIDAIPREVTASADLQQAGSRGRGRLVLDGTEAADSVPLSLRRAGADGSRVTFDVSGSDVTMMHEMGGGEFVVDFKVFGDRMIGYVRDASPAVRIVLDRQRPKPVALAPIAPPPPAPPPPAPAPVTPPPVAAAPEPTPAPVAPEPPPAETERPAPQEFAPVAELRTIHFDFDRADIRPDDAAILDLNAQWLKSNDVQVMIEGHCDERGTNEYNLALGERRAKAAREYLISRGVPADRITTVSYGEERPVCTEKNEACWKQNRRADFLAKPQ